MGAANAKKDDVAYSEEQAKHSRFEPFCIDCNFVCDPKKSANSSKFQSQSSENTKSNRASKEYRRAGVLQINKYEKRKSQGSQKNLVQGIAEIQPPAPAPTLSTADSFQLRPPQSAASNAQFVRPMIASSLSFKGSLPPDWDVSQQDRLKWAVEEVSRRLGIRPPGLRATRAIMAARSKETSNNSAYDMRSYEL